jgi:4'-phosphopantetheinyl transferase EntD
VVSSTPPGLLASVIASLLPPCAVAVESSSSRLADDLLPEEAKLVAKAVKKRRREFATGRACARRALRMLGWPDVAVLVGQAREPVWPSGIVGSITHSVGYCAATVARAVELKSIGIDVEVNSPLPDGVEDLVCTQAELDHAARLPGQNWSTVIFSAKESLYKAWYPITRKWLGHLDAELTLNPECGEFSVCIVNPPAGVVEPADRFVGRFAVTNERVFTAVIVPTR